MNECLKQLDIQVKISEFLKFTSGDPIQSAVENFFYFKIQPFYAAVNGHLELTLLKGSRRFYAVSTSDLEVYKFRDW